MQAGATRGRREASQGRQADAERAPEEVGRRGASGAGWLRECEDGGAGYAVGG